MLFGGKAKIPSVESESNNNNNNKKSNNGTHFQFCLVCVWMLLLDDVGWNLSVLSISSKWNWEKKSLHVSSFTPFLSLSHTHSHRPLILLTLFIQKCLLPYVLDWVSCVFFFSLYTCFSYVSVHLFAFTIVKASSCLHKKTFHIQSILHSHFQWVVGFFSILPFVILTVETWNIFCSSD